MAIIEMQPSRPEHDGREIQLLFPIGDDLATKKSPGPPVHLVRNVLGDRHELWVALDGQPEIALAVERHDRELTKGVLAIEHPTVGPRQQSVRDVAESRFY